MKNENFFKMNSTSESHDLYESNFNTLNEVNFDFPSDTSAGIYAMEGTELSGNDDTANETNGSEESEKSDDDDEEPTSDDSSDSETEDEDEFFYVDNNFNHFNDERIMFPASKIKVSEFLLMFTALIIRFHFTRDVQVALLNLIKILAGPEFSSWNFSLHLLSKNMAPPADKCYKNYFCETFNLLLLKIKLDKCVSTLIECSKCKKKTQISSRSVNYFLTLDIKYQFEMLLNRKDIQKSMNDFNKKRKSGEKSKTWIDDILTVQCIKKFKNLFLEH